MWRARWYNGCPKVYPRNKHACWESSQPCTWERSPNKSTHTADLFRVTSLPTFRPNSVKQASLEPLPPEQPRVVIPYSQWRRRYDNNNTRVLSIRSKMAPTASGSSLWPQEKSSFVFEACLSDLAKPRHQPDILNSRSTLAAVTTDIAKGIKTNPYAPRTGHDDPSAQIQTKSSHQ